MAKNDDRIGDLEKQQERTRAHLDNAANSIREQKGAHDKLAEAISALTEKTAETSGAVRVLVALASVAVILGGGSLWMQWGIHSKIGAMESRMSVLDEQAKSTADSAKNSKLAVEKIATNDLADLRNLTAATTKLDEVINKALTEETHILIKGPDIAAYITLGKDFILDSSEGDAVLSWDVEIAGVPAGRHIDSASITHISAPTPAPESPLPFATWSVKPTTGRMVRVRMDTNSQGDKSRMQEFFESGGAISLDFGIYLREQQPTQENPPPKN